jgi:hypothetical protein
MGIAVLAIAAGVIVRQLRANPGQEAAPSSGAASPQPVAVARHPVVINIPKSPAGVPTGLTDFHGNPVMINCQTCHSARPANFANRLSSDINEFHQGLMINHGNLACVACHSSDDGYAGLRLADGTKIDFRESMTLCAQCHGPQFRDYRRGSHGGMTGYWDLTRGPRQRNHCLDCHDPHAPQYPVVQPARGPNDRFLPAKQEHAHD